MALQIKELVCSFCGKMTQITDSVERMFVGGILLSLLRACHANGKLNFFLLYLLPLFKSIDKSVFDEYRY